MCSSDVVRTKDVRRDVTDDHQTVSTLTPLMEQPKMLSRASATLLVDIADLEDAVQAIETSFDLSFDASDLAEVRTAGDLCASVLAKIKKGEACDCTTQQAFYKLRDAIVQVQGLSRQEITPTTSLESLYAKCGRRTRIAKTEEVLGFRINALRPKSVVSNTLVFIAILSLLCCIVSWKIGALGFALTLVFSKILKMTANEFSEQSVGELSERISQDYYMLTRRDKTTVNQHEIEKKVLDLLRRRLGVDEVRVETVLVGGGSKCVG